MTNQQEKMLEAIREVGGHAALPDIAEHFEVSESTARRHLDGLVYQEKLGVTEGLRPSKKYPLGLPRQYWIRTNN